ncbi:hypothetical protein CERSUDRAFT_69809 [Gelatoporia subvermispora B]|uniref:Uncharacterized protein n=1 Tax=Ceriporiopsis subvermispora (strain B) TaxID=914234 RepID=M2R9V0_CERS8|nr:hypothetical protein CERSUDRAFT_69809 [Gelatoporia subvermispora B]
MASMMMCSMGPPALVAHGGYTRWMEQLKDLTIALLAFIRKPLVPSRKPTWQARKHSTRPGAGGDYHIDLHVQTPSTQRSASEAGTDRNGQSTQPDQHTDCLRRAHPPRRRVLQVAPPPPSDAADLTRAKLLNQVRSQRQSVIKRGRRHAAPRASRRTKERREGAARIGVGGLACVRRRGVKRRALPRGHDQERDAAALRYLVYCDHFVRWVAFDAIWDASITWARGRACVRWNLLCLLKA